jgi:uncharacterized protein
MEKSIFRIAIVVVFVSILAGVVMLPTVFKITSMKNKAVIGIRNQTIFVDVVDTESTRNRGLGKRSSIGVNEGMYFVFDDVGFHGIWMKDMQFPIDIVWIRDNRIVDIKENVDPQIGAPLEELKTYFPKVLDDHVLELKAGRVKLLKAEIGDPISIHSLVNDDATIR